MSSIIKPKKFRIHFNRINMQRGNPNVWTVHWSGVCHQVKQIYIKVPVVTVFKPDGRQPRATFEGTGIVRTRYGNAFVTGS